MSTLSIYGSHDANITVYHNGEYRIYELERLSRKRYYSLNADENAEDELKHIHSIIKNDFPGVQFNHGTYCECAQNIVELFAAIFGIEVTHAPHHHLAHAACAFYQSPFKESIILSYDAGGWDNGEVSFFNIYRANRSTNTIKHIGRHPLNFCSAYTVLAYTMQCIRKRSWGDMYLSSAGKLMAWAAYGKVVESWKDCMRKFYTGHIDEAHIKTLLFDLGLAARADRIREIKDFLTEDDRVSANLAATSQEVFNELTYTALLPYIHQYGLPLCITGGGALNIVFNQALHTLNPEMPIFVPPNPNDCGISFGNILLSKPPDHAEPIDVTFAGIDLLDRDKLPELAEKHHAEKLQVKNKQGTEGQDENEQVENNQAEEYDIEKLADLLIKEKIIGVINGRSEVGPRALGNRSILAMPGFNAARRINQQIKNREWYRPVSPVIRQEDAATFFDNFYPSPFMSFAQETDKRYVLGDCIHHDNTARVQSVTQANNPFMYKLLSIIKDKLGYAVLINTSFNVEGNAMITRVADALEILKNYPIDYVYCEGYLFDKNNM